MSQKPPQANVRLEAGDFDRLKRIQAYLASEGLPATASAAVRYSLFKAEMGLPPKLRRPGEQVTAAE